MRTPKKSQVQFVVCVDNSEYPASLELHKIYRAVPDADAEAEGDLRVVDESGEDYLYERERFVPIDVPEELREAILRAPSSSP